LAGNGLNIMLKGSEILLDNLCK